METLTLPSTASYVGIQATRTAPVLVATDGREQSDAAVAAGYVVAGDAHAVRVISVLQPTPIVSPEAQLPVLPDVTAARRADLKRSAEAQVARVLGGHLSLDVEIREGDPAQTMARVARESDAMLIVAGLGRHKIIDRVFGDETALRLIRVAPVPVLAVAPGFTQAPHRIVAAVDFSDTSRRAAGLALDLAAEAATIYLVHVGPRDSAASALNAWGASYSDDAGAALAKLRDQLSIPRGVIVHRVMLQGDPATELLAFASSVNADLIATGSHGHGFVARMLIGSVATKLVRCSTCSVLTVPHRAAVAAARTTVAAPVVHSVPKPEWVTRLKQFTYRNMVRPTLLEIDDPEIGAQAQEHDYPFLGAAYDQYDECVEVMLGDLASIGRHLTRSIAGVDSIDVLTDEQGRDIALRIAHGAGQTLLTFTR